MLKNLFFTCNYFGGFGLVLFPPPAMLMVKNCYLVGDDNRNDVRGFLWLPSDTKQSIWNISQETEYRAQTSHDYTSLYSRFHWYGANRVDWYSEQNKYSLTGSQLFSELFIDLYVFLRRDLMSPSLLTNA